MTDVNRAVETVAKLGPGHFVAVLALLMVVGAGWLLRDGLTNVEISVIELRHEVERSTEHADARAEAFRDEQAKQTRMLTALCYAVSNGDPDARRRCEDAAR